MAQESAFGWVLQGSRGNGENSGVTLLNLCTIPEDIVKRFWDLETIGVFDKDDVDPVYADFERNLEFNQESGRYRVGLVWKEKHPALMENKKIALSTLASLEKRLSKDPKLKQGYQEALEEMEDSGFVVEVGSEKSDFPVFYLPHHPCVKESSSSTKIRPVFNGSCKGPNGVSLNDCLESGPNLNPNIVDVILRFRRWRFAVCSDVKKAFLQIELHERDQDVHRFLWRKGDEIKTMKFRRVTFA